MTDNTIDQRETSPLLIVAAWVVVGLPALWGVYQTSRTSLDLFRAASAAPATQPSVQPAAASRPAT